LLSLKVNVGKRPKKPTTRKKPHLQKLLISAAARRDLVGSFRAKKRIAG